MVFPERTIDRVTDFYDQYCYQVRLAASKLDKDKLEEAASVIESAILNLKTIYVCGNGGSAAIANTLQVDFYKGISTGTFLRPKVQSLSCETSTMTAVGNDIGYEELFSHQLKFRVEKGDVLIAISSSGNSPNILSAIKTAKEMGAKTILFSGFAGGKGLDLAEINLHVPAENYGVAEDVHQSIMHVIAQFIRMKHLPAEKIGEVKF